jgi:hypothetical protein
MGEAKRKHQRRAAAVIEFSETLWREIAAFTLTPEERVGLMHTLLTRAIADDPTIGAAEKTALLTELLEPDNPPRRDPVIIKPLGDGPIEERYRARMQQLATTLDRFFNGDARGADRETGFVLLVFPFGNRDGRCNYLSNGADRADIVALFREMIARFAGAIDSPPGHA